jgi:hypothetical protein
MGTYRIVNRETGDVVCETHDRHLALMFAQSHRDEFWVEEAAPGAAPLACGECRFVGGKLELTNVSQGQD